MSVKFGWLCPQCEKTFTAFDPLNKFQNADEEQTKAHMKACVGLEETND